MASHKKARFRTTTLVLDGDQNTIGIKDSYEDNFGNEYDQNESQHDHHINGPAATDMFEETPSKVYVPFEEANRESARTDCRCYGCDHYFGKQAIIGKFPGMDATWEAYNFNKSSMNLKQLCELIFEVHHAKIKMPLLVELNRREAHGGLAVTQEELDAISWPVAQIEAHITMHMVDPIFRIYQRVRTCELLHHSLKNEAYVKQPDGQVRVDLSKMALIMKSDDQLLKLLAATKMYK